MRSSNQMSQSFSRASVSSMLQFVVFFFVFFLLKFDYLKQVLLTFCNNYVWHNLLPSDTNLWKMHSSKINLEKMVIVMGFCDTQFSDHCSCLYSDFFRFTTDSGFRSRSQWQKVSFFPNAWFKIPNLRKFLKQAYNCNHNLYMYC